jgi:lysophospholipase L1-like esterase
MNRHTFLFLLGGVFAARGLGRAAIAVRGADRTDMRVEANDEAYAQRVKKQATPFRGDLRQLFVCGDSISVGYGPALKVGLRDQMTVTHRRDLPELFPALTKSLRGYSGPARSLIEYTEGVLTSSDYRPDLLLLNCGLHDIARGPENKEQNYRKDLETLVALVGRYRATLVWAQTTPKAPGHADNPRIEEFNRISAGVMAAHRVRYLDLHAFTQRLSASHGAEKVFRSDTVHFTPLASDAQGTYLAAELLKAFPG